jgi:hypothetical protein
VGHRSLSCVRARTRDAAEMCHGWVSSEGGLGDSQKKFRRRRSTGFRAGHERFRAKFSQRASGNTGPAKLPARKSLRPSRSAVSFDGSRSQEDWPQRRFARRPLEKRHGCKPHNAGATDRASTTVSPNDQFAGIPGTATMLLDMAAKKIPESVIRAFIKRHRIPSVSTVVEDVGSIRVDPAAAGSPTPPWRRSARRKKTGEQPS